MNTPRGHRWNGPGLCAGFVLSFLLALSAAHAHTGSASAGRSTDGLPIPNLTHGQMAVISDNAAEILAIAKQQGLTDPTFRRLLNFSALQRTYCLWSVVPGSLADEESPFNECTHAYLAALRALLVHMQDMPGAGASVRPLIDKIEREMIARDASLMMCRYSGEAFNTAEVVMPHWADILSHTPSLLAFGGVAALCAAAVSALVPGRRSPPEAANPGNEETRS